jgi:predicted acetylornithine/succinylornithine family transaminase
LTTAATTMGSADTVRLFEQHVIPNYGRYPINLVRGKGSRVWDAEDREYLDLFPGWGCNLLGHCPPPVVKAIQDQAARLIHVPNTWHMDIQGRWAELLAKHSFGGQAFFCNSGAEANEAAIKLARLHTPGHRYKIITFEGGFHGRTMGAISATAQPKYHDGIGPVAAGFSYAKFGDLEDVKSRIDDETCAIMIEPIQGEGGVNIPPDGFLQALRDLADEHELVLIFDEVQTGCGRTGEWFAYQHFGVTPDVMTLAKALCGGVAGAAMLASHELAPSLRPGMHAATFGGNPIAAAAGIATLQMIEEEGLLERVGQLSDLFRQRFEQFAAECDLVAEVRVLGLMVGVQLHLDGGPVVQKCLENHVLVNCTQGDVIRLLPAMNLDADEAERGCDVICQAIRELSEE